MPLVRKPTTAAPGAASATADVLQGLTRTNPDERWNAARAAAGISGGCAALAAALRTETEPHVREAMFTSLARAGTSESTGLLLSLLRSDEAALRTGAFDGLRMMGGAVRDILPGLLSDSTSTSAFSAANSPAHYLPKRPLQCCALFSRRNRT